MPAYCAAGLAAQRPPQLIRQLELLVVDDLVRYSAGMSPVELAAAGYLARYRESARRVRASVLRRWFAWCSAQGIEVLDARRADVERYARELEAQPLAPATVCQHLSALSVFYRDAVLDGLLERSPVDFVRRPKRRWMSPSTYLRADELRAFLAVADADGADAAALCSLLALNGLRISEACNIAVDDLAIRDGFMVVSLVRKGGWEATLALSERTAQRVSAVIGGRVSGPLLRTAGGAPMRHHHGRRIVADVASRAGIDRRITPHVLRHTFITLSLDAGVSLRDVQHSAGHQDPRMTAYYDRNKTSPERHATHRLTAWLESGEPNEEAGT